MEKNSRSLGLFLDPDRRILVGVTFTEWENGVIGVITRIDGIDLVEAATLEEAEKMLLELYPDYGLLIKYAARLKPNESVNVPECSLYPH